MGFVGSGTNLLTTDQGRTEESESGREAKHGNQEKREFLAVVRFFTIADTLGYTVRPV